MEKDNRPIMVTIQCCTYNQENYIRECLEGFIKQKTTFRFEVVVHDDASTDGTPGIIREFERLYPDIIKPIYETENQYSKQDGSIYRIVNEQTHGKYIAICEGDDYWIDPIKIQKQVDFMESHPECSFCFHPHYRLLPKGSMVEHRPKEIKMIYSAEDVILGGGGFMATNSMLYRKELRPREKPSFWKNCPVGDLPLMLYLVSKGKCGYIDETMSVYRVAAIGSWSTRQNSIAIKKKHHKAILRMFQEYDTYTNQVFHNTIRKKIRINNSNFLQSVLWSYARGIAQFLHIK